MFCLALDCFCDLGSNDNGTCDLFFDYGTLDLIMWFWNSVGSLTCSCMIMGMLVTSLFGAVTLIMVLKLLLVY